MRCDEKCKWFPPSSLGGKPCTFCEPDSLLSNCYEEREEKPITNADRIRAMTDEELAEWLDNVCKSAYDEGNTTKESEPLMSPYPSTASEWITWLKQEANK